MIKMSQYERIEAGNKHLKGSNLIQIIIYTLFGLGPLTGNVILVLFGVLSIDFSVSPTDLLVAIPAFMFPFAIIQLFSGAISDVKGRFPVILFGLTIFGLGMLLATLSLSLYMFILANICGGIGFGFVNPVLIALLTDLTPVPKIPKRMGFLGAVANIGVGFGPLLAGLMVMINWRYLYILFIIITILGFIIIFSLKKKPLKVAEGAGIRIFLSHLSIEIRRPVVILMLISAFLASHTYLASVIWTSRAFTHVVPESLAGIILAGVGLMGAFSGILIGFLIHKKGVGLASLLGIISLFIGMIILVLNGDINPSFLLFIIIGLIFMGIAGGILIPSVMFYSQTLSKERRGALAGLSTAGQFIGIALVPTTYEPFFNSGGISLVYFVILMVSIVLLISFFILYLLAKPR
jgi:MFS family permease